MGGTEIGPSAAPGARVIAFPADRARPPSPHTRLARALDQLREALADQRAAALALQDASARLRTALAQLQARLEAHGDQLGQLSGRIATVAAEARTLQALADRVGASSTARR